MCGALFDLCGMDCVGTGRDLDARQVWNLAVAVSHPLGLLEEGRWQTRRVG